MDREAARPASGSLFEDRYEILGELGSGSFGQVYQARQLTTGQSVAIKLLSPREGTESSTGREAERFRRETRICAALSHTNIVRLLDSGETQAGQLYAVFEHVPGETLEQALSREGALGVRESIRLMTQVLDALACAHAKGIVHRDLKPANLMLSGTGARRNALVLDFGLGGLAEGRRRVEWETLTQTREFLGTPLYAAPEQLVGEPPTPRSDLYAWGLIFLECLTGRRPFEEAGAMERLLTGGGAVEIPAWLRGHRLGALLETVTAREAARRDVPIESLIEALDAISVGGELPEAPEEAPPPRPLAESGEHRHLTVMFCDLVDSTGLAQRLDAETYRSVVQVYQSRCADAIGRYDGRVAQYLGDGLLVYFGYPQAHEDDAERAVRAGREMLHELATLNPRLEAEHGVRLQARVGIHTGPVVVGEVGGRERQETLALGDTLNVAARLEAFAEPDTVVISDATLRLLAGLFVTEDRGTPELKGISAPIRVHRVMQPSGVTSRLDRALRLTPFVGREQELGLLLDRFEQAQEGRGQAVLIGGEAGIGKSRLVYRLREQLRNAPHSWLECRCSPYTESSALYPVIGMLEGALDFREDDSGENKLGRLERGLAHAGLEPRETVPLLASLLSLRLPERYAPLEISPRLQRQKTLETLLSWLLALSEKQPVVLVLEDLHWIDPSTLEWLGLAIEQCPTANLLLLLTHRPAFEPSWRGREHLHAITLSRLSRRQSRDLIARAIAARELPAELVARIASRSDGVPLFVEELAKGVVEAGSTDSLDIPETLQDSLMARLDRLGHAKQVAQHAAAIGREFEYELLEAVAPVRETELREGLGRLVEAELVYQRGLPPRATYTFKHALVQDTAYQSLLDSQRRELHGRIADALEKQLPERVTREPELIARHCAKAGRVEHAIAHYQRAAQRATQRFAQAEAIAHLHEAIELLGTLDATPARREQELQLQIALGSSHFSVRGGFDPEAERAYQRARELCGEASESPALFRALIGLSVYYFEHGEVRVSCELAEQALALADRLGDVYPRLVAHTRLGIVLLMQGDALTRAVEHLERAVDLYDPAAHRPLAGAWGQDWGITARTFAAIADWGRGFPERARRRMAETVALAREGDPYSLGWALSMAALLHYFLGERAQALATAEEAIGVARQHGFPIVLMITGSCRGWAVGGARGISEIRTAIDQATAAGLVSNLDAYFQLAQVYLETGQPEEALAAVQAALEPSHEIRTFLSRLHRTRGQILLQLGAIEDAERSFRSALRCAREEGARWQELLAATHLARLLRDRGARDEARVLLQPVYDWFTEGFDTADLKDARALLDELEPSR
jgi:TOMM system kinase/cyclase fusion protein